MGAFTGEISLSANQIKSIRVRRKPGRASHKGLLIAGNLVFPCVLGRAGFGAGKREGDGKSPIGKFAILHGYYRKDRIAHLCSAIKLRKIRQNDGWCDAQDDPNYNRLVTKPYWVSHETMMRQDNLYDICLVLDYNYFPRARGRGSAIFFHLQSEQANPTEGCIALRENDMRRLLLRLARNATLEILL